MASKFGGRFRSSNNACSRCCSSFMGVISRNLLMVLLAVGAAVGFLIGALVNKPGHNRSRKEGYNHDAYRISRRVTYEHATSYYSSSHCCQSHHRCISSWRKINGKDRSACTVVLPDHHAFSRHLGHGASFIDKTWQKRWSDWYSCKAKTVPKLGLLFRFDQVRFKHIHCLFAKFGKML